MTDEYDVLNTPRCVAKGQIPGSRWVVADEGTPAELVVAGVTLVDKAGRPHPRAAEAATTARAEQAALAAGRRSAYRPGRRTRPERDGQLALFDVDGAA